MWWIGSKRWWCQWRRRLVYRNNTSCKKKELSFQKVTKILEPFKDAHEEANRPCQAPASSVWWVKLSRPLRQGYYICCRHLGPPNHSKAEKTFNPSLSCCCRLTLAAFPPANKPWAIAAPALYSEQPGLELRLQATRSAARASSSGLPLARRWHCRGSEGAPCGGCCLWCSYSTSKKKKFYFNTLFHQ